MNWKRHKCPVPNCGFVSARGFFSVPEHPVRQKAWAAACELSSPFNKPICWKHFGISDFKKEITDDDLRNFTFGQLKKNVIPTKHLPGTPELGIKHEPSDNYIAYEEIEIKNEPIDGGFILPSLGNKRMKKSSFSPAIQQKVSETNANSKTFDEPEKCEESGIYVKFETDIKPEILFGISESDSNHLTVSNDSLNISVYEEKPISEIKILFPCCLCFQVFQTKDDLKKHALSYHDGKRFEIIHHVGKKTSFDHKSDHGKKKPTIEDKSRIVFPCCICFKVLQTKSDLKRHALTYHDGKRLEIIHHEGKKTSFFKSIP